jgi:hypothetical protein
MADKSDVEVALAAAVDAAIYPLGDGSASACGFDAVIYRGFAKSEVLDASLAAGTSHVTIAEQAGYNRLTGGYIEDGDTFPGNVTLTVAVAASTVTFGGTAGVGQLAGVWVDGSAYSYNCGASDTPATVAMALAALVNGTTRGLIVTDGGDQITDNAGDALATSNYASVSGSAITFATNRPVQGVVTAQGTFVNTVRWQVQGFRVTVLAPTPAARDALCSQIDAQLANVRFLSLPGNQSARLQWRGTYSNDVPSQEGLWTRDIFYTAQFATTITTPAGGVLFGVSNVTTPPATNTTIT